MIYYSTGKLALRAAKLIAVMGAMLWMCTWRSGWGAVGTVVTLGLAGFSGWRLLTMLPKLVAKDMTALGWDDRYLQVNGLTSSRQVLWTAVEDIAIKRRAWLVHGSTPIWVSHYLIIRVYDEGSSLKMRIPIEVLAIGQDTLADFINRFEGRHAQLGKKMPDQPRRRGIQGM